MDYSDYLNTEQLDVVLHGDGPCLVLAGAGSGKTRTITYRVAYLLEQGVRPDEILLVTFTNKAAKEMIGRVGRMKEGAGVVLPWAGTFHHIAYRILHECAPLLGYKQHVTILDSEDSLDLLKRCLKDEGIDRKQRRFPSPNAIFSTLSFARNANISLEEVFERKHPEWADMADIFSRIRDNYMKRKKEANVMDFDDLLVHWHRLLASQDSVRETYSEQFRFILVDEYQDTNAVQASIIRLLASKHQNILVVGDDAQSIYSFRAANIENILHFEKQYPDAKIFRLETNYRSTPDILDLANAVISNNRAQYEKQLKSRIDRLTKPEVRAFADETGEAEFIADRIVERIREGVKRSDISVLFRAAHHSQALELQLNKRHIPYEYRGGVRFFERAHIKDVLAYVRIFYNRNDAIAWSRVLNMQVGIGPAIASKIVEDIQRISDIQDIRDIGLHVPPRAEMGWKDFISVWNRMKETEGTPRTLIEAILDSKYKDYLQYEYDDARDRIDDIEQLARFAEREDDLHEFLATSALQEQYGRRATFSVEVEEERVVLSTVHQAKGLEWDTVFIIHLARGQFPNDRAFQEDAGLEEERRLFYVAITRAKRVLYLSYPIGSVSGFLSGPSVFLEEIDRDVVKEEEGDEVFLVFDEDVIERDENGERKKSNGGFLRDISEL